MTILVDWQLLNHCHDGTRTQWISMISPFDPALINPASVDVRLGDTLLIESAEGPDLKPYPLSQHTEADPYWLRPGQFVLGCTLEQFSIPNHISAQFLLKSSRAREGLNHMLAGYCDPGWNGSVLTLELHNVRQLHSVPLWPGMRIGQMVFHALDSVPARSYGETGRYNGDTTVQGSRG